MLVLADNTGEGKITSWRHKSWIQTYVNRSHNNNHRTMSQNETESLCTSITTFQSLPDHRLIKVAFQWRIPHYYTSHTDGSWREVALLDLHFTSIVQHTAHDLTFVSQQHCSYHGCASDDTHCTHSHGVNVRLLSTHEYTQSVHLMRSILNQYFTV